MLDINKSKTTLKLRHFVQTGNLMLKMIANSNISNPLYHDTEIDQQSAPIIFKLNLIPGISTCFCCSGHNEPDKKARPYYVIETDPEQDNFFFNVRREIKQKIFDISSIRGHNDYVNLLNNIEVITWDLASLTERCFYETHQLRLSSNITDQEIFLFHKAFNLVIEKYLKTYVIKTPNKDIFKYANSIKDRLYLDVIKYEKEIEQIDQLIKLNPGKLIKL